MQTSRRALLATVTVAALALTGAAAGSATAASGGDQPWIAYQTNYHKETGRGPDGVWLVHPDGTGDHQVGAGTNAEQALPDWSPDGARLVFATRGFPHEPLYEYELATGSLRQLFACDGDCLGDDDPAYSPDGSRVAFIRAFAPFTQTGPSDCSLWIGEVATGEAHRVTRNGSCDRENGPRWSPDGTRLTYYRELYDWQTDTVLGTAVFVLDVSTGVERQVTPWGHDFGEPDWSPDGEWILMAQHPLHSFNTGVGVYASNLFRVHPDGTGLEQVTSYKPNQARATQPRYTRDGAGIVFTLVTHNSRELWILPVAGGKPVRVTNGGVATHGTMQP